MTTVTLRIRPAWAAHVKEVLNKIPNQYVNVSNIEFIQESMAEWVKASNWNLDSLNDEILIMILVSNLKARTAAAPGAPGQDQSPPRESSPTPSLARPRPSEPEPSAPQSPQASQNAGASQNPRARTPSRARGSVTITSDPPTVYRIAQNQPVALPQSSGNSIALGFELPSGKPTMGRYIKSAEGQKAIRRFIKLYCDPTLSIEYGMKGSKFLQELLAWLQVLAYNNDLFMRGNSASKCDQSVQEVLRGLGVECSANVNKGGIYLALKWKHGYAFRGQAVPKRPPRTNQKAVGSSSRASPPSPSSSARSTSSQSISSTSTGSSPSSTQPNPVPADPNGSSKQNPTPTDAEIPPLITLD